MAVAALALAPAVALAAQPLFVSVGGHVVPAQGETHVVQTSAGPMKVSTWSWHGPGGTGTLQVQTSRGGPPPAWALQQMRDMTLQMSAMQAQMRQLQQAAFSGAPVIPAPMAVMFAMPQWAVPAMPSSSSIPVIFVEPGRAPAAAVPKAVHTSAPAAAPARAPRVNI